MDLTIDTVYNILKEYHPMIYNSDLNWLEKGKLYCKQKIKEENYSLPAKFFMINYYINMFKEEHLRISLNRNLLPLPYYPKFFTLYDGKLLYIKMSNDENIKTGSVITHIDKMPFLNYLKKFVLFNNGSDKELSDLVYASYLLFLDYNNPYLPAPKLIKIENVEKKLTYVVTPIKCINKFNPNNIEIPENEYNIYKNNNIIYLTLPSFENPTFKNLKALLPANKIVIDLRYNYGGDLKHVLNFFNIVYNLKIKWGICVKNSNLVNDNNYRNIKSNSHNMKCISQCSGPKIKPISSPSLEILVNEYSKSACRTFCQIALIYVKNIKIKGKINLYPICGETITFETSQYILKVPSMCYPCKNIYNNLYNLIDNLEN